MNSGLYRGSRAAAIFAMIALPGAASASPRSDDPPGTGTVLLAPADSALEQDAKASPEGKKGKKKEGADAPVPPGWHRDGFKLSNGDFKFELNGYLQENGRSYRWDIASGDETKRNPTHELGRLRMGFDTSYRGWSFQFAIDPRSSQTYKLKDLFLAYEFSKKFVIQGGHFKPPFSADFLTSAAKTDFVDRSLLVDDIGADRDWGGLIHGTLSKLKYQIGVFAGDGSGKTSRSKTSGVGRLTYALAEGLVVGGSYMQGKVAPNVSLDPTTEPDAKGFHGQTEVGWTYWRRPHVNGTRRRVGFEASFTRGPFRLIGEAAEGREQRLGQGSVRQDLPDSFGRAWYVTASYIVTGEKKVGTIRPNKGLLQGGIGAIELVARVERLNFDDVGPNEGFAGYGNRARNIAPTADWTLSLGINWWLTSFLKFQADAYQDNFNDLLIAPEPPGTVNGVKFPGKAGGYWSLVGRFQIGIP